MENTPPTIEAVDKTIYEGEEFDPKKDVKAYDNEDGDITNKLQVVTNNVNTKQPGKYSVVYKVLDSSNEVATKTIYVTVKENTAPEISAKDIELEENTEYDPKKDVKATDKEDGDITNNIKVKENTVNTKTPGTYKVVYEVKDSLGKITTKEIKVTVKKKEEISELFDHGNIP